MERCLSPLAGDPNIEVIVVDNASRDGTVDIVLRTYSDVKVVETGANLGFAKANNVGFTHCSHEFVLLLNPDAFLDSGAQIDDLIEIMRADDAIALVGPQLRNVDGSHQTGDAGWKDSLWSAAGHMLFLHRLMPSFPALYISHPALLARKTVDVDWVCGACLLARHSAIAAYGGLDEKIFMYGEDVEWGERMRAAGRRVVYTPFVNVLHLQGATQRKPDELFYSTKWIDNRAAKHARRSGASFRLFRWLCLAGFGLRLSIASLQDMVMKKPGALAMANTMKRYLAHVMSWSRADFAKDLRR